MTLAEWAEKYGTDSTELTDLQQEEYDALAARVSPREGIVKFWSTPTKKEAIDLFHSLNTAGNNQIEKAHLQETLFEEAVAFDQGGVDVPSLMRPRIKATPMSMGSLIEVKPRIKEYVPYDFWLLGTPITGLECSGRAITPEERLGVAWASMIGRCYNPAPHNYHRYGALGVSVCKRWHQVGNYIADVQKLHGWASKLADWGWELDKDHYSSNQYNPETCIWTSQADNTALKGCAVLATNPFGAETEYVSFNECSRFTGMALTQVQRACKLGRANRKGTHIGWKVEYLESEYPLRRPLNEND